MNSPGKDAPSDLLAKLNEYQGLQQQLNTLSRQINEFEVCWHDLLLLVAVTETYIVHYVCKCGRRCNPGLQSAQRVSRNRKFLRSSRLFA